MCALLLSFSHLLGSDLGQVGKSLAALVLAVLNDTSIGIRGKVAGPLDKGGALELTASDGVEADGADDTAVAQGRSRGDDRVGDVVVDGLLWSASCGAYSPCRWTYRVLLLLDLEDVAILERPLDNVGIRAGTLDELG